MSNKVVLDLVRGLILIIYALCFHSSCDRVNRLVPDGKFTLLDSTHTGVGFTNTVTNTEDFNIFNYRNFYNGGGVAIGDVNNDGLPDLYFTANMGANKLYINQGNLVFRDFTDSSGLACEDNWSTGVVMVDINNDDFLDIYVCNAGLNEVRTAGQKNKLFINNKNNTFTESAAAYGLDEDGYTTHAAFFDYDHDGDLDVYILNNSFIPVNTLNYSNKRELRAKDWPVKDFLKGGGDKLLRNDNGKFSDVSEAAGIYGSLIGFGLGVNIGDLNDDTYPDIYVSNDFFERDYLYLNQKNGTFKEELEAKVNHLSMSSMGADIADINNDGYPEIFTTDMLPFTDERLKTTSSYDNIDVQRLRKKEGFYDQYMQNSLQLNNKDGSFTEIAQFAGVAASDWSWGALMFDIDNDMHQDIYVCNGIYHDVIDQDFIDFFANELYQKMAVSHEKSKLDEILNQMPSNPIKNVLFKNNGNNTFNIKSEEYGLGGLTFSNGAAYADLDSDGDLDLVVNNVNQTAMIYRNDITGNRSINIKLRGTGKNTFAVGAKIKLFVDGDCLMREIIPSRGFQSSVDYVQTIGIGSNRAADSMTIIWPDGLESKFTDAISSDSTYIIYEDKSIKHPRKLIISNPSNWFIKDSILIEAHKENEYLDFYSEPNLPMLLSREGPAVAIADIDGNGWDDIFIGGARGQVSCIYRQMANGRFVKDSTNVFDRFTYFEDAAACFSDVTNDGLPDLIIGSGGNDLESNSLELLPRLFVNAGDGKFVLKNGLPSIYANVAKILPWDFDLDGDQDLFFGIRNTNKEYGSRPDSYIFVNDGKGNFSEGIGSKTSIFKKMGMVRDACIADLDGGKKQDLIVVGDWMYPQIIRFQGGRFEEVKTNLRAYSGFYGALHAADIDKDGDQDLLLGNLGLNFNLKADNKNEIKLFVKDFDGNGLVDKILTRSVDGLDKPVFLKRELIQQIVSLKKQNLKHATYAGKTIYDLFDKKNLAGADVLKVSELRSYIALNQSNGKFDLKEFPQEVQWSCINSITTDDLDGDGTLEIFMGGNNYNFNSNFTKLDANKGIGLKKLNGNYEIIPNQVTGYRIKGEVKKIDFINKTKGDKKLITFLNNDAPVWYKLNK